MSEKEGKLSVFEFAPKVMSNKPRYKDEEKRE